MESRATEIQSNYMKRGDDTVAILSEDYAYLLRMTKAMEEVNAAQQKVYVGSYDRLDFTNKVEEIITRT